MISVWTHAQDGDGKDERAWGPFALAGGGACRHPAPGRHLSLASADLIGFPEEGGLVEQRSCRHGNYSNKILRKIAGEIDTP